MRISVLIVSYNVREELDRCLASIDARAEVIVVDNASRDGTVEMIRARHPWVRVLASPTNDGYSVAVNKAAREATGQAFLVLNPDTELRPGALDEMARLLSEAGSTVEVMGFRQEDDEGRFQLAVGPAPSFFLETLRMVVQRGLDRHWRWPARVMETLLSHPRRVGWIGGSALLTRREAFARVGGFDEGYFLYFEDADYCLRVRESGGQVVYDPRLTLVHVGGASMKKSSAVARRAYRESQRRYWQTHRGSWAAALISLYQRLRGVAP